VKRVLLAAFLLLAGCETRDVDQRPPTYADEVGVVLVDACAECHGPVAPEADYDVTSFYASIGCVTDGRAAVLPPDASAPVVAVLSRDDHAGLVEPGELALLTTWVTTGATDQGGAQHPPGFMDPRGESFHGWDLREDSWDLLYDPTLPGACGQCHEGSPTRPEGAGISTSIPDCTTCHDGPGGVLDCATCHGNGAQAFPPRDVCYFGDRAGEGGAHATHDTEGYDCVDCHGERDDQVGRGGLHGNGSVEVEFGEFAGGADASYDAATGACTVYCHTRGGTLETPRWVEDTGPLDCQSCHLSPPTDHFVGPCNLCHTEANADGTALSGGPLHLNGVVDFGDGSGGCGGCHGAGGDDAWPRTHAHDGHREPTVALQASCESCHPVPMELDDPGHMDGVVQIVLTGLAAARGVEPVYDDAANTCVVACHGEGLEGAAVPLPVWTAPEEVAGRCNACHGLPPAAPHPDFEGCASTLCHGGEVSHPPGGPEITEAGRTIHVDGMIDFGGAP